MTNLNTGKRFHIKKEAPEGGYGYIIPFGIAIPGACSLGSLASFGLLFNDFLTELGAGTRAVTIITGTYFSALSFAALAASILFKKYSLRAVGVFGAVMYFVGSLLTVFVTSVTHLIITFGVLEGAGVGFMICSGYSTFNLYFVRKRMCIMSLSQAIKGVILMGYPIMVQSLMDKFGFRGATAIIAAIHAHTILSMVLLQPIEWHYKIKRVPIDESESLMNSNEKDIEFETFAKSHIQESDDLKKNSQLLTEKVSTDAIQNNERNDSISQNKTISSAKDEAKTGKWQTIVNFFDLTLFKDWIYVNILVGQTFAHYADSAFFTLLPLYLFELGYSKKDTALMVSIGSAADMSSRIFLALISLCIQSKARTITLIGCFASIVLRFVFLCRNDFIGLTIIIAALGFFRTWLHVTIALSFAEHLPQKRFAAGYSTFLFFKGNFIFLISPVIGWIRDTTQSYFICFNTLTFIMSLCAIPWAMEMLWTRLHSQKRKIQNLC